MVVVAAGGVRGVRLLLCLGIALQAVPSLNNPSQAYFHFRIEIPNQYACKYDRAALLSDWEHWFLW